MMKSHIGKLYSLKNLCLFILLFLVISCNSKPDEYSQPTDNPTRAVDTTNSTISPPFGKLIDVSVESLSLQGSEIDDYQYQPDDSGAVENAEIISIMGLEKGGAYIAATRRDEGYLAVFQRDNLNETLPMLIIINLVRFEFADGPSESISDRWTDEEVSETFLTDIPQIGNMTRISYIDDISVPQKPTRIFTIEYTHSNLLIQIVGIGNPEKMVLERLLKVAEQQRTKIISLTD